MLGRHKSTMGQEFRQNRGLRECRPKQAHTLAIARHYDNARSRVDGRVWQHVDAQIREAWSPEQVVSRLKMEQGIRMSHEWILPVYLRQQALRRQHVLLVALSKSTAQAVWGA